jgi:hypothetical protein
VSHLDENQKPLDYTKIAAGYIRKPFKEEEIFKLLSETSKQKKIA